MSDARRGVVLHPSGFPSDLGVFINGYTPVKLLGSGTFGRVFLAQDNASGQFVAIKCIERGEKVTKYVQREVLNHRRLLHAHIVQLLKVDLTPTHLALVMEYCPGGDLFEHVVKNRGLQEGEARWFFQQLVIAVDYLHKRNIVSRDIKLENTLLDNSPRPLLKLCDFGYSKHNIFDSAPGSRVGTPAYLAPEVVTAGANTVYDAKKSDLWSCGVMLYIMLAGTYPFERPEDHLQPHAKLQRTINRIITVDYIMPASASPDAQDLLSKLLVGDPNARLNMEGVMRHAWFNVGLPAGVLEMNDALLEPRSLQTEQEVYRILAEATQAPESDPTLLLQQHAPYDVLIEQAISHAQELPGIQQLPGDIHHADDNLLL